MSNAALAGLSDDLLFLTVVLYAVSMLAFAGEIKRVFLAILGPELAPLLPPGFGLSPGREYATSSCRSRRRWPNQIRSRSCTRLPTKICDRFLCGAWSKSIKNISDVVLDCPQVRFFNAVFTNQRKWLIWRIAPQELRG